MHIKKITQEFIVPEEIKPFDNSHASTLIETKENNIIAAWFAGSKEKAPDVAIWAARRINGIWEAPRVIANTRGVTMWNPVLFQKKDGTVILFYKVGAEIPGWKTWFVESHDGGATYTAPKELVEGDSIGGRGPVKNKPIRLEDGTILAPASLEGETWDAFVDISKDDCATWEMSSLVPVRRVNIQNRHRPYHKEYLWGKGIIQPSLWQDETGDIHMLLRSTSSRIFRSDSKDGGYTWCTAYDTGLPNNNSGIDLVKMQNGDLILVYNPRENLPGYFTGARTPLTVAVSKDNGTTFTNLLDLETAPGDYCYPSIICNEKNELLITYTWKRQNIVFCKLVFEE